MFFLYLKFLKDCLLKVYRRQFSEKETLTKFQVFNFAPTWIATIPSESGEIAMFAFPPLTLIVFPVHWELTNSPEITSQYFPSGTHAVSVWKRSWSELLITMNPLLPRQNEIWFSAMFMKDFTKVFCVAALNLIMFAIGLHRCSHTQPPVHCPFSSIPRETMFPSESCGGPWLASSKEKLLMIRGWFPPWGWANINTTAFV